LIFNELWDIGNNDNPIFGCTDCGLSKMERSQDEKVNFVYKTVGILFINEVIFDYL
jgi:hypothetical protein